MRANICDPQDAAAVARFKSALALLDARPLGHAWAIGVDHWQYRVGDGMLNVFADTWSVDIEGPREVVELVVAAVQFGGA